MIELEKQSYMDDRQKVNVYYTIFEQQPKDVNKHFIEKQI